MPSCDAYFEHRHDFIKKEFSTPIREQMPPDFTPSVVMGSNVRLLTVHIDRFKSVDLGFIDYLEVESNVGYTVLNATNPLALEWIAAVEYGIFGYPTRIEMNECIPERVRNILNKLLTDKLVYEK